MGETESVEYVEGLEDPSELANVIRWRWATAMRTTRFSKVVGGSALRALRAVWV